MWSSIEDANKELNKAPKLPEAYLSIIGPEQITRSKPEIPDNLAPGEYEICWMIPSNDEATEFRTAVKNKIQISSRPIESEVQTSLSGGPQDVLAIAQLLAKDRLADREAFYKSMLDLQSQARKDLEQDRAEQRKQAQEEQREWLKIQREAMREMMRDIAPTHKATPVEDESEGLGGLLLSLAKDKEYEGLRETLAPVFRVLVAKGVQKIGGLDIPTELTEVPE